MLTRVKNCSDSITHMGSVSQLQTSLIACASTLRPGVVRTGFVTLRAMVASRELGY